MGSPAGTPRSAGNDGVDLNSLPQGSSYDYELLWTTPGLNAPYAHGTGQITVGVATPATRTVSYQQLIATPYINGYDESGTPTYGYTYTYETRFRTEAYVIPAPYSATSTTAANTAALSQDTLAAATFTQAASLDGDTRWTRPVITQKVDRWGNIIQTSDSRSANWLTTYRYNANNQLVEQTRLEWKIRHAHSPAPPFCIY